jgi:dUTP pyrophosphatase
MQIRFHKICDSAKIPTKVGELEAGFDIATTEYHDFQPGESHIFHTGLTASIDEGYCVVLFDRSGMGAKKNIHRLAGVIDCTYRGEWLVCLTNLSKNTYEINAGDKIVQGLVLPVPELSIIEVDSLDETARGCKGFGSSDCNGSNECPLGHMHVTDP